MIIKMYTVGPLKTNCYVVGCEERLEAVLIDPGFSSAEGRIILDQLKSMNLKLKYVINTHGHFDHILGNSLIKEETGAEILIHRKDAEMILDPEKNLSVLIGARVYSPPAEHCLEDDETISIGELAFKVMYTPGHTSGSISLLIDNILFSGDTLFAGSIGRTDLPGSSYREIIRSIREKLLVLSDDVKLYPGHGPISTIGEERRNNPYIIRI